VSEFDYIAELVEFSGMRWQEAERLYRIMNEPNTTIVEEEEDR